MAEYHNISEGLQRRIREDREFHWKNPYAFEDTAIVRRYPDHDIANLWRPAFVRDTEKIMHIPYYCRYGDKTQVFSLYKNDDISRRALHVQLVARIARNIGRVLGLNEDLIEAISLGHDIGHTPFGHVGEKLLSKLYQEHAGRFFNHNVHSVRVLDVLCDRNISLQTLDGILCHNGEIQQKEYRPAQLDGFEALEAEVEACYVDQEASLRLVPSTLEACVMRISDIIAYLGKDRQDAMRVGLLPSTDNFFGGTIGSSNAEIINNLTVNIIENSYGKPYLTMDEAYYETLEKAKKENYEYIYGNTQLNKYIKQDLYPMFQRLYETFLSDLQNGNEQSWIYRHHIAEVRNNNQYSRHFSIEEYCSGEPNQIVVDYLASMTDDYFMDCYKELYPKEEHEMEYIGYFR